MQSSGEKKSLFLTKIVLIGGLLAIFFVGMAVFREMKNKKQIQDEIEKLQAEAEKINRENLLTQERIAYLNSEDYRKKEAKDKLNLQSPDENVVIIKSSAGSAETNTSPEIPLDPPKILAKENYIKWWEYFFK